MRLYKYERASGLLVVKPLSLELSQLVGLMNGHLDRDNMPTQAFSGPNVVAGTANRFKVSPVVGGSTTYYECRPGLFPLDGDTFAGSDRSLTITTGDSALVIYASCTLRSQSTTLQTVTCGFGIMVDGHVVAHTGCETFSVDNDDEVYVPFALFVGHPVGAGTHIVMPFIEVQAATVGSSACEIGAYKAVTVVREARR